MLLESLGDGEGLGIPVPMGYSDVQGVEDWPLFRSFAMDDVYVPTGFLTARFSVVDITEHVEVITLLQLFRSRMTFFFSDAVSRCGRICGSRHYSDFDLFSRSTLSAAR